MIRKLIRLLVIVSVAGGIPYAWFHDGVTSFVTGAASKVWQGSSPAPPSLPALGVMQSTSRGAQPADSTTVPISLDAPPATTLPATPLQEVLRFDVDDKWVIQRWPRVSTILSAQHRQGMRVALVTGTRTTDLAGSLSYYFDRHRRVRTISFEGHTGDASELIQFTASHFGIHEEPSVKAGLYLARWNGYPTTGLYIRHAPVVREHAPHTRLEVRFEINRPDAGYALSHEFLHLLNLEWLTRSPQPTQLAPSQLRESLISPGAATGGL